MEAKDGKKFILIGAGLPRTGTFSTKAALETLLGGVCYHMDEVEGQEHNDFWADVIAGKTSDEEFRRFFAERNVISGVDYPFSAYYKKALQAYPDAKVLLTVRDPKRWYESVKNTILNFYLGSKTFPTSLISKLDKRWENMWYLCGDGQIRQNSGLFGSVMEGEEAAVKFYNDWVEEVKRVVPEDKLLVFSVKEGWEPLCKFLEVPVPEKPYPNVNDTAQMKKALKKYKRAAWTMVLGVPVATGVIAYGLW
eukprot:CAMPEP_0115005812 /NCGR_PEP_ID=MMETSP0216-20121206/20109_1 /TAXON_ID=223996 /ORGANISM="Protocruzia adherens, Strain Boccale" /LENGTH=250 /DNA_ID=CAMNT_0002372239 /DNA_START=166 /DNA_END=915 /DNA_ORIENTATION=+